jgi:hypothetical protein
LVDFAWVLFVSRRWGCVDFVLPDEPVGSTKAGSRTTGAMASKISRPIQADLILLPQTLH